MRRIRAIITAAAVLSTLGLTGGGSADAATRPAEAAMAEPCNSNFPGSGNIQHWCGLYWITYDGRAHYFVRKYSDSSVWHTWDACSGCNRFAPWTSLGGTATGRPYLNTFDSGRALRVQVRGTDARNWCRSYNDPNSRGTWTGWYTC